MKTKNIFLFLTFMFLLPFLGSAQQKIHAFTLKECIQYGLAHHLSVKVYANKVEQAHQKYRESRSAYLPQISVSAGLDDNIKLQQTVIPAGAFGQGSKEQRVAFGTQYNSTLTAQLNQTIYNQSQIAGIKAAKPNKKLAQLQKEQNNESIIYNIATAYYQILVTRKKMNLLKSNKERFSKILKITKLRAQKGVAQKVDVQQVQVNLNNVLSQISTTKSNLRIAINTLKNHMGLAPADSITLSNTAHWFKQSPSLTTYPDFNYSSTLSAKTQKTKMKLYYYNKKSIKAKIIPTLSFYARYGANTMQQKIPELYDPLLDYSSIGIKLKWNIFTGFQRDAQYQTAVLDFQNAKVNYRLNKTSQNLQYQNAEAQSYQAQRTIRTNKENLELASHVYDNTTLQYRHGAASLSDLLNAELSYKQAQNNYIESLLQYYRADLAVHQANGTLEEYYNQL